MNFGKTTEEEGRGPLEKKGRRTPDGERKAREGRAMRSKENRLKTDKSPARSAGESIEPRRPRTREGASAGLTPVNTHSEGSKRRESTQKRDM